MKTVLEPETKAGAPAAAPVSKVRETRVSDIQTQQRPSAVTAVQREADYYESCLDLSAQFLPRG